MTIGLSTAWAGGDHTSVEETIRRAQRIGFGQFEIGVGGVMPTPARFVEIAKELGIEFVSVHNIAYNDRLPRDEVRGDGLSSVEEAMRRRAIDKTLETIDLARAVGARHVVIHAGDVDVDDGAKKQNEARRLIEQGRAGEAAVVMRSAMRERGERAARNVELAAASLSEVFKRSGDFPLAVECRVHYYSIPLPSELEFLRRVLGARPVLYCHDAGHARVGEVLGLPPAREWLERFGDILAEFHLHDVRTLADHQVPGTGDLDFRLFAKYARPETLRIMELTAQTDDSGLLAARAALEEAGLG